ncbi:outer membrane protein assembly factor BamB family protein [Flagellimonas alvinocaridis]|uniref:outer membrane protein assembly factor BamB family protein n=1 Tax=Flagellimonas alvinocaridis TaxID=2530200 RepID=UPI00191C1FD7|nr:PQQ-binding-like beta-propeller repeat protein [Allomuricauda alvinocaridis]
MKTKRIIGFILCAQLLSVGCGENTHMERTWSIYKADKHSSSFSPLKQISKENVAKLQPAWTFRPNDAREGTRFSRNESNPIVVDGVMYTTSARHRLYALEASTGKLVWSFDPFDGGTGGGVSRGVTYWEDGDDKRILFTAGDELFAVEALTGKPILSFGVSGRASMNVGLRGNPDAISVIPTSPGIVYNDLLIMGTEVSELYGAEPGYIRAYDIRTGELKWKFHTIPKPGEVGYDTWPKDAWKYAGGANNWAGMSIDEERGMVFVSLGSPTYDYYGADREGMNLFGNCVVALDAGTGKYIWHFQTVHHDLWDYDLAAPPNLVTLERDGQKVDAVAQTSKVGFLYVLDRETGEPLFPVEERPVPASNTPGEHAWPTQPFPLKPAPYARQSITADDLSFYSQESHDSLLKAFNSYRYEGVFTPPDTIGTFMFPGSRGGSSWGGGAYDPNTGVLYVKSNDSPEISLLKKVNNNKNHGGNTSLYEQGEQFYKNFCASCHGADKNGQEPDYPSLLGLEAQMDGKEILKKIADGVGKMPSFSSVLPGEEEAILAYLFEQRNTRSRREDRWLKEVQANEQANTETQQDTLPRFLNIRAYGYFRDSKGRPGIKPPWGTLNAINLNTGEYEWKVPVGNYPDLQEEGMPITGTGGSAGPIVTAGGIVFLTGTHDDKLFAFDKDNGQLLWETLLPTSGTATPSTYMSGGKQYLAVAMAGNEQEPGGYIMAFALPE